MLSGSASSSTNSCVITLWFDLLLGLGSPPETRFLKLILFKSSCGSKNVPGLEVRWREELETFEEEDLRATESMKLSTLERVLEDGEDTTDVDNLVVEEVTIEVSEDKKDEELGELNRFVGEDLATDEEIVVVTTVELECEVKVDEETRWEMEEG